MTGPTRTNVMDVRFEALDDLLMTGPTRTNVMDVRIMLIGKREG